MGIAAGLCFIILLVATGNVVQAAVSLICVAVVIVTILSIEYILGWEIGVSESLCMVILIGFSVDYVVHLSSDYIHSAHTKRAEKM